MPREIHRSGKFLQQRHESNKLSVIHRSLLDYKIRNAKYKHLSQYINKKNMPFVTPLFVYLQFVYKFVCFFMQKAAIKVKDRDSGVSFDFFAVLLPCGFIVP